MLRKPRRILLLKYRGLGDAVIGLGAAQYLRELFPASRLVYGVPAWVAPLFAEVKTAADEIVPLALTTPGDWATLAARLGRLRPELVYELFLSGRTSTFFRLLAPLLRFEYRFHDHHGGETKPAIQRDLDGIHAQLADRGAPVPSFLDYEPRIDVGAVPREDAIVVGVVATRATKQWPLDRYAELLRRLAAAYPTMALRVPLSTSPTDSALEQRLRAEGIPDRVEIVRAPLAKLPRLLASARLYVGNDTGLKHIAVAVGVRTITFFGPDGPREWHPYAETSHRYFFREPLACRTATAHFCGLETCESMACLNEFDTGMVFSSVRAALEAR